MGANLGVLRLIAGAAIGTAAAGHAQVSSEPRAAAAADRGGLEEIVVTAERRATNLQDTPISILAVTDEAIAAKGIDDLQDLSNFTPNLTISASRGNGNNIPNFSIRGISGGGGATSERGVGLYIDGIYVPRTSGSVLRVLDIDRVEVLRGPQGTLFGRNSTGGAIRIFSKQPSTTQTDGYVRATGGNFDRVDLVGMLNLPLTDTFAIRTQGAYLKQDGFVQRGTQKLGGSKDHIGRFQARWQPADGIRTTFGILYSDSQADGTPLVFRQFDMRPGIEGVLQGSVADWINDSFKQAGQAPLAALDDSRIVTGDPFRAPDLCLLDDFNPDYDDACRQFNDNKYFQLDLNTELDLSDNDKLTIVSGYSKLKHKGVSDYQLLGMEARRDDVRSTVAYNEVQLNSALFDDAVDLVTGLNYFYELSEAPNFQINRRGTSIFPTRAQQTAPGFNVNAATFARGDTDAGLFRTADTFISQISRSYGAFVSATWHATEKLNLTGGLRYAYDRKRYRQTRFRETFPGGAPGAFTPAPGTDSTTVSDRKSWEQVDYRATVDYHFTDDVMAYATVSKAYKAGQYSYVVQPLVTGEAQSAVIRPIPPEKVRNFEIGSRLTLFDRRVRFNPTLFYMEWTNRQSSSQVACATPGVGSCPTVGFNIQLINSGDAKIWGGELDMQVAVVDGFTLDGSIAFTDYKLSDFPAGQPNLFPDAPSPTFNVGATYSADVGFGDVTLNANYAYIGAQDTHPTDIGDSAYRLPAYGLVNARIAVAPSDFPVTVALFANNLLDNTYASYGQRFGGGFWDAAGPNATTPLALPDRSALGVVRGRPREIGVTMQYNF